MWYPEVFEKYNVVSVHQLLKQYIEEGRIKLDKSIHEELTTVHDPCNYGRKGHEDLWPSLL